MSAERIAIGSLPISMRALSIVGVVVLLAALHSSAPYPLAYPDTLSGSTITASSLARMPMAFEQNEGQVDPSVQFIAHYEGGSFFFTRSEVVLALPEGNSHDGQPVPEQDRAVIAGPVPTRVIRLQFVGAEAGVAVAGEGLLPGRVNYFVGKDPSGWRTGISSYRQVVYAGLYPGIDLNYAGTPDSLKATYTVAPGADPALIRWRYEAAGRPKLDAAGNLELRMDGDADEATPPLLREDAPVAWQEISGTRIPVDVAFSLSADGNIGFTVGNYVMTEPLIIDPTLTYSTYLGGTNGDGAYDIAVDAEGNAYVIGSTASSDFPVVAGAYQDFCLGCVSAWASAFVSKFNAAGTELIYSTFVGGSGGSSYGSAIAVDTDGNAYLLGDTVDPDFPLVNPYQSDCSGCPYTGDAFVAKLSPDGSELIYATYLGGSHVENSMEIALDTNGHAYVTGGTYSTDFPTANALPYGNLGDGDVFVTKLTADGSDVVYSTLLGGVYFERGYGIAVDAQGNTYVAGGTRSWNFPTVSPLQRDCRSCGLNDGDAFVSKLNPNGTTLLFSTFLGGGTPAPGGAFGLATDEAYSVAVDAVGNIYVAGFTQAADFPVLNPIQESNAGFIDVFVTKINATATRMLWSTYLGGSVADRADAMAIDTAGNVHITGVTLSGDYPTVQPVATPGGDIDVIVTKISSSGARLLFSTYLGSGREDWGRGIAVDPAGNTYITGDTGSTGFPVVNAFQASYGGVGDAFVAKIFDPLPPTPTVTGTPPTATPTRTPTCPEVSLLAEGFETAGLGAFGSSGSPGWSRASSRKRSGTYSAFAPDAGSIADQRLSLRNGIAIPADAWQATLAFWHSYSFDTSADSYFGGGVIEVSANGGAWLDAGPNFTVGGYNGTIATGTGNPLANRQAWVGTNGTQQFAPVRLNLLPYAGQSIRVRFRLGSDEQVISPGWWIDDLAISVRTRSCPTATRTATPTRTQTGTATVTPSKTPSLTMTTTRSRTSTPSRTPTRTRTSVPSRTPTRSRTSTPSRTPTRTPAAGTLTPTPCAVPFTDIAGIVFEEFIRSLYCQGIIEGYPDNTFGPNVPASRATLARWVVKARGWQLAHPQSPSFVDVAPSSMDYLYIETAKEHGVINGYEPSQCPNGIGPCFKPDNNLSRGQMSKMIVNAMGWPLVVPTAPHFIDVGPENVFYERIETIASRSIVNGYEDGTFRPNNPLTRGQLSKVLDNAIR